ncbi:MAG: type II toxin-antitoxin system HicB family antitoxin [Actinobacteria bacterium]|nr:type II toxin-antitoxin system HicB family antitoxin [Actinomycetota bacterium]MBO0839068.1 type II toxin-antitoxin system HicB family antitoxin [Actinomycetota bacterium]
MPMKTLEDYLELPYAFVVTHDVDEEGNAGWVAEVEELPGCISQGRTPEEAVERARMAMRDWISVALDDGVEIPEPRAAAEYSGHFVVRVPSSLHADLVRRADREGVSLNQFVASALAGAVGWRAASAGQPRARRRRSQGTSVGANR